jgi:hypothetical protein
MAQYIYDVNIKSDDNPRRIFVNLKNAFGITKSIHPESQIYNTEKLSSFKNKSPYGFLLWVASQENVLTGVTTNPGGYVAGNISKSYIPYIPPERTNIRESFNKRIGMININETMYKTELKKMLRMLEGPSFIYIDTSANRKVDLLENRRYMILLNALFLTRAVNSILIRRDPSSEIEATMQLAFFVILHLSEPEYITPLLAGDDIRLLKFFYNLREHIINWGIDAIDTPFDCAIISNTGIEEKCKKIISKLLSGRLSFKALFDTPMNDIFA